jgi:hypothetical protein
VTSVSAQLDFHPETGHQSWLVEALAKAAAEAGATQTGEPVFGWREPTISAQVTTPDGERWLRVVSEQ